MKKLIIVLIAVIVAAGITVGVLAGTGVIYVAKAGEIDREGAKDIALGNANLTIEQVYDLDVDRERRGGEIIYEVEFKIEGVEHHYTLDVNGNVLAHRTEIDDDYAGGQWGQGGQGQGGQGAGNQGSQKYIGNAAATDTALAAAGVTPDEVYGLECEVEHEHGQRFYEVEFEVGGYEYEVRVDVSTGEVLWSNIPGEGMLSPDDVKELVCEAAKKDYPEIAGKNLHFDIELTVFQGQQAYEVEFECRELRKEFTYFVDAANGTVLHSYSELDD